MAQRTVIDLKKLNRDLERISNKFSKIESTATYRTINVIADRSRNMIAVDVKEDTGIAVGTTKRRIQIYKAGPGNYQAALYMKDTRITYPSPRQLVGGVSFIGMGKKRKSVKTHIQVNGGIGSKPFVAKLPSGGYPGGPTNKKAPVYVRPEYVNRKGSHPKGEGAPHPRRISAMYFSSLPHLARKDWQNKVSKFSISEFRREYPKQLKSANKGY